MTASPSLADPELRSTLARTVARRIPGPDIEDIVQSVFAEAMTSGRLPESQEEIRRFLLAIARQRIVDWYRRDHRRRRREAVVDPERLADLETTAANDLLRWAVATLPDAPAEGATQTFSWMLREGEGETLAEIAAAEQIPAANVRQRVSRLRRFFRARWTKEAMALGLVGVVAFVLGLYVASRAQGKSRVEALPAPVPSTSAAPAVPAPAEPAMRAPVPASSSSAAPTLEPPRPVPPHTRAAPRPPAPRSEGKHLDHIDPWGDSATPSPSPSYSTGRLDAKDPWGDPWGDGEPVKLPGSSDPWR
jgi:RNA polymerase sigma factor (sigma-70 family)